MYDFVIFGLMILVAVLGALFAVVLLRRRRQTFRAEYVPRQEGNRRLRMGFPEALPNMVPEICGLVDAYAVVTRSLMTGLRLRYVLPQPEDAHEDEEEADEQHGESDEKGSPVSPFISFCDSTTCSTRLDSRTSVTDFPNESSEFHPVHLAKVGSIHRGNSDFSESVTLLCRLPSCLVFGRASYLPREAVEMEMEDFTDVGPHSVNTFASESYTSLPLKSWNMMSLR